MQFFGWKLRTPHQPTTFWAVPPGLSARQDRSEKGVYLNIEPKYLTDYAVETAFREDHRRLAPGAFADRALSFVLRVGPSQYWRDFSHGAHRSYEILANGDRPDAKASGPAKGRSPIPAENGRPPRWCAVGWLHVTCPAPRLAVVLHDLTVSRAK